MISRLQLYIAGGVVALTLIGWAIYAIGDAAVQRDRMRRTNEGIERQTTSDTEAEKARRLSDQERCRVLARQSGMSEASCER